MAEASLEKQKPPSAFQVWKSPDQRMTVYVPADTVWRLSAEIQRSLKILPRRNMEVGGVLLGTVESTAGRHRVCVEKLEPVECSHGFGPTWTLTGEERNSLAEQVWSLRAKPEGPLPVGLFRSRIRTDGPLQPEDTATWSACFSEPYALLLEAHPSAGGALDIAISWRDGILEPALWTGASGTAAGQKLQTPQPAPQPPDRKPATSRKWMLIGAASLWFGISAAIGTLVVYSFHNREPVAERIESPLSLEVENRADHLVLSWNRTAPIVQSATGGQLFITDGGSERNVRLSANQVRAGRVFYQARSGEVDFRLEIERPDGRSVSESTSSLALTIPGPSEPDKTSTAAPAKQGNRTQAAVQTVATAASRPTPPPRPFVTTTPAGSAAKEQQPLEAPPSVGPAGGQAVLQFPSMPAPLQPPKGTAPGPASAPASRPVTIIPPAPQPAADRSSAPAQPAADHSFATPQPIHQVTPVLPPEVRGMLRTTVEVQVRVSIDINGKVTRAVIAGDKGVLAASLNDAVLSAARKWTFSPARANGHVLPSEKLIVFTITPR